jgi:hypothetical protein
VHLKQRLTPVREGYEIVAAKRSLVGKLSLAG